MNNITEDDIHLQEIKAENSVLSFGIDSQKLIKKYGVIILLAITVFSGMIIGSIQVMRADDTSVERIQSLFSVFINTHNDSPPIRVFANSFAISFAFAALLYISSFSVLGIVNEFALLFLRGAQYGILSGLLCLNFGVKGLLFYISVNMIGGFLSSLAMVYQSQYCMDFSMTLLWQTLGRKNQSADVLKDKAAELTLNSCFVILAIIFASLTDTLLYYLAGGFFSF